MVQFSFPCSVKLRDSPRIASNVPPALRSCEGGGRSHLNTQLRQAVDVRSPRSGKYINKRSGRHDDTQVAKRIAYHRPAAWRGSGNDTLAAG